MNLLNLEWWGKHLAKSWWCRCLKFWWNSRTIKQKILSFQVKGSCCGWQWLRCRWLENYFNRRKICLGKEDGVGDMIKDDCDKHDDDNCDDDCYDNTSCNVLFIRVFFHRHWRFTEQQGKGGDHLLLHSTTLPAHEHWDIYLQLCMMLVYLMSWFWVFVTAILTWEAGGFELASTITLVLQANRQTKCAVSIINFENLMFPFSIRLKVIFMI